MYCDKLFQDEVKDVIEKNKKYRVVFNDDKNNADFVLTDKIGKDDENYTRVGWSPLVVAIPQNPQIIKTYEKNGYIIIKEDSYNRNKGINYYIDFLKVINNTINGTWVTNIYCPKIDTVEGRFFKEFLISTVNDGKYPSTEEELENCEKEVKKFLESKNVIQTDVAQWYSDKKVLEDELCILFENEIYGGLNTYPNNTVIHEWYFSYPTNRQDLKKLFSKEKFFEMGNRIEHILYMHNIRTKNAINSYSTGFSAIDIPIDKDIFEEEK